MKTTLGNLRCCGDLSYFKKLNCYDYSISVNGSYVRAGHKPGSVPRSPPTADCRAMTIHLASMLPSRSSDLPGNSDGPSSFAPLFGLAPGGVCIAPVVTDGTGELLPHPFTLTWCNGSKPSHQAVSFLLHFPSRHRDWVLPSTLSCGARTFLPFANKQSSGHLSYSNMLLYFLL